jgi:hypothetical protein
MTDLQHVEALAFVCVEPVDLDGGLFPALSKIAPRGLVLMGSSLGFIPTGACLPAIFLGSSVRHGTQLSDSHPHTAAENIVSGEDF